MHLLSPRSHLRASAYALAAGAALVMLQACGGDSTSAPKGPGPVAALVVRSQPAGATAGAPLTTQPVLELRDANGQLVPSDTDHVTVAIASGGGTLGGTTTVQTVGGVATFTNLAISGAVGDRTLRFSLPGRPTIPAVASQTISLGAGAPAAIVFTTVPSHVAQTLVALDTQPTIRIVDASGNQTSAAVPVKLTVQGTGAIAAGDTVVTTANGVGAFTGLTLGALNGSVGDVTLHFTAAGLTEATSNVTLGCYRYALGADASVSDALQTGDCVGAGSRLYHLAEVTSSSGNLARQFTMNGDFQTALYFRGPGSTGSFWGYNGNSTTNQTSFYLLAPAGTSEAMVTSANGGTSGSYTLASASSTEDIPGCVTVLIVPPITTTQSTTTTDCAGNGYYGDFFNFPIPSGVTVTVTMTTDGFDPYLSLWQTGSTNVNKATGTTTGTTTTLSYTNDTGADAWFYVYAGDNVQGATGNYTLTITPSTSGSLFTRNPLPGTAPAFGVAYPSSSAPRVGR